MQQIMANRLVHSRPSWFQRALEVCPIREDERLAEILRELGCAYIRIASIALDMESRMIVTNDRVGSQEAARHLAKLGHTRIAVIAGRRSFRSATERRAGFEEGLAEFGITIPPEYILQGDYTFESGLALGSQILDLDPPPTAVFSPAISPGVVPLPSAVNMSSLPMPSTAVPGSMDLLAG